MAETRLPAWHAHLQACCCCHSRHISRCIDGKAQCLPALWNVCHGLTSMKSLVNSISGTVMTQLRKALVMWRVLFCPGRGLSSPVRANTPARPQPGEADRHPSLHFCRGHRCQRRVKPWLWLNQKRRSLHSHCSNGLVGCITCEP